MGDCTYSAGGTSGEELLCFFLLEDPLATVGGEEMGIEAVVSDIFA